MAKGIENHLYTYEEVQAMIDGALDKKNIKDKVEGTIGFIKNLRNKATYTIGYANGFVLKETIKKFKEGYRDA